MLAVTVLNKMSNRLQTQWVDGYEVAVEENEDGFVAYPLGGLKGAVVGEGETSEEAIADVRSAIRFHIDTFGPNAIDGDEQ